MTSNRTGRRGRPPRNPEETNGQTASPNFKPAIKLAKAIVKDIPGLDKYYALGKAIIEAVGNKKLKREWIVLIEENSGLAKSSLTKATKFAKNYSQEQLDALKAGAFVPSWHVMANNLSLGAAEVLDAYAQATDALALRNALRELKRQKAGTRTRERGQTAVQTDPNELAALSERLESLESFQSLVRETVLRIRQMVEERLVDEELRAAILKEIEHAGIPEPARDIEDEEEAYEENLLNLVA